MTQEDPMHITVFGATGKVGRLVVDQLLARGHTVTAYVRDRTKVHHAAPAISN